MNRKNVLNTLDLYDQSIFNDKIKSIPAIEFDTFVLDWEGALSFKRNPTKMKLMTEALFISRLKKAWSQRAMNFDSGADDPLGQVLVKKFTPCLRVSVVNHVCSTPTLNSATSGFSATASSACMIASRVSLGSMILSIHSRAAP